MEFSEAGLPNLNSQAASQAAADIVKASQISVMASDSFKIGCTWPEPAETECY